MSSPGASSNSYASSAGAPTDDRLRPRATASGSAPQQRFEHRNAHRDAVGDLAQHQ